MTYFVQLGQQRISAEPNETLLAAGLRQGLALPYGCQSGRCGSCRVRKLHGTADVPAQNPGGLSPQEVSAGYLLLCQARARSDIQLHWQQPEGMDRRRPRIITGRVESHRGLAPDVVELTLKLPRGEPFEFLPGQYVDFLLPDGGRRSFSIATAEARDLRLQFHLRVTPDGRFARFVRDEMPERSLLRFEGPLGAFYLREVTSQPVLMVAGGTGFAPIKAMLEQALAHATLPRVHLFWGARDVQDLYMDGLARRWAQDHPELVYTPVLSAAGPAWQGARGMVHAAVLDQYPRLDSHGVYLAGPPAMVYAGRRAFLAAGLDPDRLFYDSFDFAHDTWPGGAPPAAQSG